MNETITFTLLKSLACYVAALVPGYATIIAAIAKASVGAALDDEITVTVTQNEVVTIYQQLTATAEGVAAINNNALEDILLPLLPARPELAEAISTIKNGNEAARTELVNNGLAIVTKLQQALQNN